MNTSSGVQVIAITSGKGGVGKTNAAVNIAVGLKKAGQKVLLLDADLGLANVDVMIGLHVKHNLSHVLHGEKKISEILVDGPAGIRIVPAASGVRSIAQLEEKQVGYLVQAFSELSEEYDYLIIDTAAGIAEGVVSFLQTAHHVIVVAVDEPTSITDAYAMIKIMRRDYEIENIWVLSNMVDDAANGRQLFEKINRVAEHFLGQGIKFLGAIPIDPTVKEANRAQQAILELASGAPSSLAYKRATQRITQWPKPSVARGQMEFFVERFIDRDFK